MKISKQTFNLDEELIVSINHDDNDGLINIPKNINLDVSIVNYFGKIVINSISLNNLQDELSLSKIGLEQSLSNLDIKLLDRFLFKQLSDKATFNYSPFDSFLDYDFSVFEKSRRISDIDWSMFASLYIFACNVIPESIKVELTLAKKLRVSEESFRRFLKKIPETIFRKTGHLESRGGNLTFDAEEIIKKNLTDEQKKLFEESPFLKFHSGSDLA
tara:strand:- start:144 stop:791 length:648 start_codon:yes stop_codon:yes gene_type:complete